MIKIADITAFVNKYQLLHLDEGEIANRFNNHNLSRIKFASLFVVLLSFYHLIIFLFTDQQIVEAKYHFIWKWGIVGSHAALFIIFGAIAVLLFNPKTFHYLQSSNKQILETVAYLSILFISNAIALFDQLITPAITPIFLGAVAVSLIVLIPPIQAFAALAINLFLFIYFSPLFQINDAIVFSNNLNVLTAMVISFVITNTLWIEMLRRIKQEKTLRQQHLALEKSMLESADKTSALEVANLQNKKLFSIIGHDLRGPFNTLIASSELLLDNEITLGTEELTAVKTNLLRTAQSTYFLLENLLGWSQMQQNRMIPQPKLLFPAQALQSAIIDCKHIAEAKSILLETHLLNDIQCVADSFMLQTIFRNLLMNAIKFSYREGVIVVEMTKNTENNSLSIDFTDHGIGMSNEVKASLFQNMNSQNQGTSGETGTGLGLLLCKEFSELNQATISIESAMNKGSTFTFNIPLADQHSIRNNI